MRRNVLIFHSGALGDFILTWPLAMTLGRLLPQSRIFYITHGQKGKLAEKVLAVESADIESGWHHLFAESLPLPDPAARLLAGAQWVFSFVAAEGSTWARSIARLAPQARLVCLSQSPPGGYGGHLTDYLVEQLHPWTAWEQGVLQILRSIAQRGVAPRRNPSAEAGGLTVIHPGSGSPHKCWPTESFLELTRRLDAARGAGPRPRVIIGEVEMERWTAARIDAFNAVAELRRPQTLVELFEAYAGAARFIGNDSGPGHLAAITGIPTLSLFGPTDPARWRPLGPAVTVLRRNPLRELGIDEVIRDACGHGT
jgi:ADP-heptose:LPS heptosyltransferase